MALRRKKGSVIDLRLKQLDREMARLNSEVKAISNSGAFRVLDASRLKRGTGCKAQENRELPGRQEEPSGKESAEGRSAGWGRPSSSRTDARVHEAGMGREKFVNYFSAGHFQDLRPLRQESRVLRNKAIMMVILVAVAAFGLFFFLR